MANTTGSNPVNQGSNPCGPAKKEDVMYKIKYSYRTGDSFHSEDREDILDEIEWSELENAEAALERIREHYEWYESLNGYSFRRDKVKRPEWHEKEVDNKDPFTNRNLITLKLDNGNHVQFWAPWCGYFETLYGAEIVLSKRIRF